MDVRVELSLTPVKLYGATAPAAYLIFKFFLFIYFYFILNFQTDQMCTKSTGSQLCIPVGKLHQVFPNVFPATFRHVPVCCPHPLSPHAKVRRLWATRIAETSCTFWTRSTVKPVK
jgi:hypothetical protein